MNGKKLSKSATPSIFNIIGAVQNCSLETVLNEHNYAVQPRDVIRRLCNKDRDQGQIGVGDRYRSCSDIQYIG